MQKIVQILSSKEDSCWKRFVLNKTLFDHCEKNFCCFLTLDGKLENEFFQLHLLQGYDTFNCYFIDKTHFYILSFLVYIDFASFQSFLFEVMLIQNILVSKFYCRVQLDKSIIIKVTSHRLYKISFDSRY